MADPDLIGISKSRKVALLSDGTESPFVVMFAAGAIETDDPMEAVSAIAMAPSGQAYCIVMDDYEDVTVQ